MADDPTPTTPADDPAIPSLARLMQRQGGEQADAPPQPANEVGGGKSQLGGGTGAAPLRPTEPAVYNPDDLTQAAGTVGALTDWITASSLYPNRPLALGTALVIVGTLGGQRVEGPTHGSTHLFFNGIAASASGKQQQIDRAQAALNAAGAAERIGAGDFRSSVAFVEAVEKQSAFCALIDEYGLVLQRATNKGAGNYELDLISVLQQLWGINWTFYYSPAAARKATKRIYAPSVSICGFSTPETFYGAISQKQIYSGLLNRHLIIQGDERPVLKHDRLEGSWEVPATIAERLKALYPPRPKMTVDELMKLSFDDPWLRPQVRLTWGSAAAKQIRIDLANQLNDEPDELRRNLFGRVPEMTVRLATNVAYGRFSPTVDELDMLWARAWALRSAQTMHEGVLKHSVDPLGHAALCRKVIEWITEAGGWISKRDLYRKAKRLISKGGDIKAAIEYLKDSEEIREEPRTAGVKGGRPSPGYALCD